MFLNHQDCSNKPCHITRCLKRAFLMFAILVRAVRYNLDQQCTLFNPFLPTNIVPTYLLAVMTFIEDAKSNFTLIMKRFIDRNDQNSESSLSDPTTIEDQLMFVSSLVMNTSPFCRSFDRRNPGSEFGVGMLLQTAKISNFEQKTKT